jgi:hypothetical protein
MHKSTFSLLFCDLFWRKKQLSIFMHFTSIISIYLIIQGFYEYGIKYIWNIFEFHMCFRYIFYLNKFLYFFFIHNYMKLNVWNNIWWITKWCNVYNLPCFLFSGYRYICLTNWISNRNIIDESQVIKIYINGM